MVATSPLPAAATRCTCLTGRTTRRGRLTTWPAASRFVFRVFALSHFSVLLHHFQTVVQCTHYTYILLPPYTHLIPALLIHTTITTPNSTSTPPYSLYHYSPISHRSLISPTQSFFLYTPLSHGISSHLPYVLFHLLLYLKPNLKRSYFLLTNYIRIQHARTLSPI